MHKKSEIVSEIVFEGKTYKIGGGMGGIRLRLWQQSEVTIKIKRNKTVTIFLELKQHIGVCFLFGFGIVCLFGLVGCLVFFYACCL